MCIWETGFRDGTADSNGDPLREPHAHVLQTREQPRQGLHPILFSGWALVHVPVSTEESGFPFKMSSLEMLLPAALSLHGNLRPSILLRKCLRFCSLWGHPTTTAAWTLSGQAAGMRLPIFQAGKLSHRGGGVTLQSRTRTPQVSHLVY